LRNDFPLNDALGDWIARAVVAGRNVRRVRDAHTAVGPAESDGGFAAHWGMPLESYRLPDPLRLAATLPPWPEPFASIVMLSWNAPHFTEVAVASIREHTRLPYEIIVIDNGSEPETLARLAQLQAVRIIYNAKNTGFAFGCNQGLAAARGTHVVLLNNDVVVTAGWLEAMIDIQRRNPTVGMSAPYSNHVGGIQQIAGTPYTDIADLPAYAAKRSAERRGRSLRVNRAVGFCLCISRRVVEEIGGLDPRYGLGGFEDDDFCLRVRAAGYEIAICADSFVHHFGEASFKANQLDASTLFFRNKAFFERRWGTTVNPLAPDPKDAYDARAIIRRGFDRTNDFVALPEPTGVSADWAGPA
jgi:GT2 family glycosyltransferase